MGGLLGGGQRVGWPPLKLLGGLTPPPSPLFLRLCRERQIQKRQMYPLNLLHSSCVAQMQHSCVAQMQHKRVILSLFLPHPLSYPLRGDSVVDNTLNYKSQGRRSNQCFSSLSDKTKPRPPPASVWPNWYTAKNIRKFYGKITGKQQ